MIEIVTGHVSPRLAYTIEFIFERVLKVPFFFSETPSGNPDQPCIVYGELDFDARHIKIPKSDFMDQEKVVDIALPVSEQTEGLFLFPGAVSSSSNVWGNDLFSAVFWMISRYEEYLPFTPDQFGRFPASASFSFRNKILETPVVDVWILSLKKEIEKLWPNFHFPEVVTTYLATYDIDVAYAYGGRPWWRQGGALAKSLITENPRSWREYKQVRNLEIPDPYDTYSLQRELKLKYNFREGYFFLLGDYGKFDKNLSPSSSEIEQLVRETSGITDFIGIHPSFKNGQSEAGIKKEKKRLERILQKKVTISRQHYLQLSLPITYRELISAGIEEDYTMGYADQPGFRAGTSYPFTWFDLPNNRKTNLTIHPFAVMDGTLKNYLKLDPPQALARLKKLYDEVDRVNGQFITVWHNTSLTEKEGWEGWCSVYREAIKYFCR